jgi:threonine synthase
MQDKNYTLFCTGCKKQYPFSGGETRCSVCGEPLELPEITQGKIDVLSFGKGHTDRYADFFPYFKPGSIKTLGEGGTGLVEAGRAASEAGFESGTLFLKNETQNPTWSFKDRGTATAANYARLLGFKSLGVCSSGNMAASVSAYAAALGMRAFIFIPSTILEEKVLPIALYGATVIKVRGDYAALYKESRQLGEEFGLNFVNSDVPLRVEGSKSIAYEICEQFDFDPPEWVLVPTSSGGNLRGVEKGFREFKKAGIIGRTPNIVAVQAGGCAPVYRAWKNKAKQVEHFGAVDTIAPGIGNPHPPSGNQMLRLIEQGLMHSVEMVEEKDILPAQRTMAKSGVFGQPASCVPYAAAASMLKRGVIKKGERVVCIVTGSGLKAASVLKKSKDYSVYEEDFENIRKLMSTVV